MRKSVASQAVSASSCDTRSQMANGLMDPAYFRSLQDIYQSRTGYNLVLSDINGSIQMGLPDCEQFPCMLSCRECREGIIREALRTGKVCVDTCHEGYVLWGLPYSCGGAIVGGLVVIGGEMDRNPRNGRFSKACGELYRLMLEKELLPNGGVRITDHDSVYRYVCREVFSDVKQGLDLHGRRLIDCLQTAEFDAAKDHFLEVKKTLRRAADLPLDLVRGLVGKLIFSAKTQFIEAGIDPYASYSEAGFLLEKVAGIQEEREVEDILEAYFDRFVLLSRQRTKDPDDLLIEKATTYLEQHVREELTREKVARAVGISPSHFSRLIREKKGRTFTDLLNQYRIEHACKLLVRSSNTLAHIANEAGFCDQSYFSKVFRRYKDMSPAQYRDTHQV